MNQKWKNYSSFHRKKGRNHHGKITSRHRGGGHPRLYRKIERLPLNLEGCVQTIEYDPNRSASIALIRSSNGSRHYQLCPVGWDIGTKTLASLTAPLKTGNRLPLKKIPLGTNVYNIELSPGKGGQLVRSAGTTAFLMAKFGSWVTLRLPSNEIRLFSQNCWATLGQVSNMDHLNKSLKKAGRARWLGRRPRVRGSAKNPVDHPHGGGEGGTPIGKSHPVSPWGKPTLGKRTRRTQKYSDAFILRR
uniref:Large ribosomal subunit protein uL2m n=1 Tax=Rhipilia penicilloides TaxID=1979422 RepID=A0A2P0QHM8_9CHLO|nr:ribosomal protein L2 [Rhipilia penicilloides]ARO74273.1 ribosomal protein L2 [Rhipilia penicilloides]